MNNYRALLKKDFFTKRKVLFDHENIKSKVKRKVEKLWLKII